MNVAVIQARMGSTRFPGKTLADVCGRPMLSRVVERVRKAKLIDKTVVATTARTCDDAIASACGEMDVACYRGNAEDVLDRFYCAAKAHSADAVVRVTADCPLIDPEVIDKVVERFQEGDCDYVSNTLRYSYPDGLDTEVFSFRVLEEAWQQATQVSEREHVTPYLRKAKFRTANVECESTVPLQRQRWTVDYPSDLEFVQKVYSEFAGNGSFGFRDVVQLLERKPAIAAVRGKIICNEGYYRGLYREAVAGSAPKLAIGQSLAWLARSQKVIPGGAQTFSKAHTQYVQGVAPIFLARGKGARVWDVDGNEYIDYVQGLLPNILGYANEEVNRAVAEQIAEGHSFSLAHPIEVELAERLTNIIPCAEMVRFGKNGSDVTSGAVRAARAYTGRERIVCCGYHGWQDWYIGSTSRHLGVPAAVRGLTHSFRYNDLASLEAVLTTYNGEFGAVIMEPFNFQEPAPGFLQGVKDLAHNHGALLIFDEICSGFHFGLGGAQKLFGVIPDLACFGKAMGNGFPISCVVGGADVMRTMEKIFFSSTFAGETSAMAAAMKVFDVLENTDALTRIEASGRVLQDGTNVLAKEAGLEKRLECVGRPQWSLLKIYESDGADSLLLKNLFQQEAIKRGILLLATHNLTAAHDSAIIDRTLEIYAAVIKTLAGWLQDASPAQFLEGTMSQPIFRVR